MEFHPKKFLGFTLLLAGLALCGAGLWLLLSPAQYQATARIKVVNDSPADDSDMEDYLKVHPEERIRMMSSYDAYYIKPILFTIQSATILSNVVTALNLNVEWGKKYGGGNPLETARTVELLKQRICLSPVRNRMLIEISFRSEDPNEAASIANAIAKAYYDHRMEMQREMTRNGLQVLTEELQKQEQIIKTKQENLEQLRKQLNVPNPEPADELLKTNYASYFQAKQELQKRLDFHKLLDAHIAGDKLDIQIPRTSMVEIVDAAQPPKLPSSPNRLLGVVVLAIGLVTTFGGLFLIKSSSRLFV